MLLHKAAETVFGGGNDVFASSLQSFPALKEGIIIGTYYMLKQLMRPAILFFHVGVNLRFAYQSSVIPESRPKPWIGNEPAMSRLTPQASFTTSWAINTGLGKIFSALF